MSLSDEFKQALRSGDLSKAFTMVASKAAILNITTRIVRDPNQGEPYPPNSSLHTQVDLINGTVENDVGEAVLNTAQYQNLQHFHQQQVALSHRKIQENFQGLQQLFQLLVTLQQYDRLMNAEEPLDLKFLEIPNQTLMAATVKVVEPFTTTPPQDDHALPTVAPSAPMEAVSKSQPDVVPEKNEDLTDSDSLNFLDNFADIALDETPDAALTANDVPGIEAWETPIDTTAVERANGDRPDAYVPNLADFEVDSDPFGDEAIAAQADLGNLEDDLGLEDLLEDPETPMTEAVTSPETADLDTVDDETLFTFLSQDWHNHPGVTEVTSLDGPETSQLPLPPLPENWLEQELAAETEALPDLSEAETKAGDGEEDLEGLEDLEDLDETTADFEEDLFPEDLALGELPEDELGDRLTEPFPDVITTDFDYDPEPSSELTTDDALAGDELELTASDLEQLESFAVSGLDDLLESNEEMLIATTEAGAPEDTVADHQYLPTDLEDLDAFEFNIFPTDLDENTLGPLNAPDFDSSELALDLDLENDGDIDIDIDLDPDGVDADFDLEADPLATADPLAEEDFDLLSDFELDLEPMEMDPADSISDDSGLDTDSLEATDALFEEDFDQPDDFEFDLEQMDLSGEMTLDSLDTSLDLDFEQQDFTEDINAAASSSAPDASPESTTDQDQDAWLSEMTDLGEEDEDIFNLGEFDESALLDFDLDQDHLSELDTEALDDQENSHDFEAREFSKETVIQADFQQPDDLNLLDAAALSFDDLDLDLDPQNLPLETMTLLDDDLDLTVDLPSLDNESHGTSDVNHHHDAAAAPTNDFTDDSWLEELDLSGELDPDFDLGLDEGNSAVDSANFDKSDQESAIDLSTTDEAIAPLDDLDLDEALADLEELNAFDSKDFDDLDLGDEELLFLEEEP
ncbi:hypothetical protein AWQ21_06150 [Picosynechococcus sp. PCC 7003]|uniref:hypothetical protein n=1 Tax=Picosynechococcus sp. PCC 7003 TaxID=374981 RepID=UPI000810C789|nr:hypothetical protein [Picosynechococcus sp. PCC 7003]ANV83996.1 hypothetical protein AWQ21_06150 [Picosynechococcus sp. PCC 7003]